jgi:hypothetical protein
VVSGNERDDNDAGGDELEQLHDAGIDDDDQLLGAGDKQCRKYE